MADVGPVAGLWRYPVKSMRGEPCSEVHVGGLGVAGGRAHALVDSQSGKIASAINPRLWPDLLSIGRTLRSDDVVLSVTEATGRCVTTTLAQPGLRASAFMRKS